jgi:hypothetical protein
VSEFETEYMPGLPERLPQGERLLWQGKPQWHSLAVHAFHARSVAIYFGVLIAWRGWTVMSETGSATTAASAVMWMAPLAFAAVGVLLLLAWLSSHTTVYSITSRRVVMRFGIALPMTLNIPFCVVDAAALFVRRNGTGDIPLALAGSDRIAFAVLWPHARPWRVSRPEPMLRALPDAAQVAQVLSHAMTAASGQPTATTIETSQPSSTAAPQSLAPAMEWRRATWA